MSGFKGHKWLFQFLLLTIMSEPNVGTSECLVKETTRLLDGGVVERQGKKLCGGFFHCPLTEKKCVENVSYIKNGTEQWRGGGLQQSCIDVPSSYLRQNDKDK